jgi:ribulose 1,5-bisphosphate carboxylase large subunit-like protein
LWCVLKHQVLVFLTKLKLRVNRMDKTYTVTYKVDTADIDAAANAIAIGQSIGNPSVRNEFENQPGVQQSKARVRKADMATGTIIIEYPYRNMNSVVDINHMMCTISGGQSDIDLFDSCRITNIDLGDHGYVPLTPTRQLHYKSDRPLIGSIVKPKAGLTSQQLRDIVTEMCDGGVDFIKEDEILGDPAYLPLKQRIDIIEPIVQQYPDLVYNYCVNGNPQHLTEQLDYVRDNANSGVHINFWSGLGAYQESNKRQLFTHFQRSGIRILTDKRNPWGIDWPEIVKLAALQGINSIHIGMLGGYYPSSEIKEVLDGIAICRKNGVIPALSCGMNDVVAEEISHQIGNKFLANIGGWLHTGDSIASQVKKVHKRFQ